eukprot:scaffold21959_cov21-Tisochrysis_lutea.AAC.1
MQVCVRLLQWLQARVQEVARPRSAGLAPRRQRGYPRGGTTLCGTTPREARAALPLKADVYLQGRNLTATVLHDRKYDWLPACRECAWMMCISEAMSILMLSMPHQTQCMDLLNSCQNSACFTLLLIAADHMPIWMDAHDCRSAASGRLKASRTRLRRLHGGKVIRNKWTAPSMAGQSRHQAS